MRSLGYTVEAMNATVVPLHWRLGAGPLFATAIHHAHGLRAELRPWMALGECERAREEDPYTDHWARLAPSWLLPGRSRFEVDLNRPPREAVYTHPDMAWGQRVWNRPLPAAAVRRSLALHAQFYARLRDLLERLLARHGKVVVLDLHAYNHRREGPWAPPADPTQNPEINVGTGSLDRARWAPVVERFMADLRDHGLGGRPLDVRENVKFRGRYLAQWVHARFPGACVLAVEFKKIFMDEWTGIGDPPTIDQLGCALRATFSGLVEALEVVP